MLLRQTVNQHAFPEQLIHCMMKIPGIEGIENRFVQLRLSASANKNISDLSDLSESLATTNFR